MEIDSYHQKAKVRKWLERYKWLRDVTNIVIKTLSATGDENYSVTYFPM